MPHSHHDQALARAFFSFGSGFAVWDWEPTYKRLDSGVYTTFELEVELKLVCTVSGLLIGSLLNQELKGLS